MKILVTGSTGFIGRALVAELTTHGYEVVPLSRTQNGFEKANYVKQVEQIESAHAVVHLAGVAHRHGVDQSEYDLINYQLTKNLAKLAADKGFKHFLNLSTAKVHGEETTIPISSHSDFNPQDHYSDSKARAEKYLSDLNSQTQFTSIRPPVVYGKNPKANILKLINSIEHNKPIPLPIKQNSRSFVSLKNITNAICAVLESELPGYNGFLVDDRKPVSTEQFIMHIAKNLGRKPKIIRMPNALLQFADKTLDKAISRSPLSPLYKNFVIECDELEKQLNWSSVDDYKSGIDQMLSDL